MYRGEVKDLRAMVDFLNCELEKVKFGKNDAVIAFDQELVNIIKSGKFISAVKEYRTRTGCSLRDAVNYVRALREEIIAGKWGTFVPSLVDPGYLYNKQRG